MRSASETKDDYRIYVLIGSVLLLLISAGGMFLVTVSMKELQFLFGARSVPSLAFSLQFIGSGIGGIIMGYVLDRWGFGIPALVGTLMVGFGAMLASGIESAWELYVIYGVMFGLAGQGALAAPALANIAKWYDKRRGTAVGIVAGGQALAGVVWPPVFSNVQTLIGWREMFFWYGVFALVVLLPLVYVVKRSPPPPKMQPAGAPGGGADLSRPRAPTRALTPNATTSILCCAIFGCCVAMALPLGHLISHVRDLGFTINTAAEIFSITLFAAFVSRALFVGLLADRFGGLRSLFVFSLVQGTMLATMVFVTDLWALYVVGALFGLGYGGIFPVYAVAIREHLPINQVGRRTGVVFMFGAVAMGLGSAMGGYLFDLTGSYTLPFLIGAGFNVANLFIVAGLIFRIRPGGMAVAAAE